MNNIAEYNEYKPKTFIDELMLENIPFFEEIWIKLLNYKEQNNKDFDMLKNYKAIMSLEAFKNFNYSDSNFITNLDIVEYTQKIREILLSRYNYNNMITCTYCEKAEPLIIGKTNDYGIAIQYPNKLIAYGYDIHGSNSNGLIVKINYCPMCGKIMEKEK